jgi:hypothetical protein
VGRLILSGGGFGVRVNAWPEALGWLAAAPAPISIASLASDDERQADALVRLLAERGCEATLFSSGDRRLTNGTIFLCGGDATLLASDSARAALLRRWIAEPGLTVIADSASAMALGRRAASCTCGGHAIRTVAGLAALGPWSILAHADGPHDARIAALHDPEVAGGGEQLALQTGEAVEVLGLPDAVRFERLDWSAR